MERRTELKVAQKLFGSNLIGPESLEDLKDKIGIISPFKIFETIPHIPFDEEVLERCAKDSILILGVPKFKDGGPLTINKMRDYLGCNPSVFEPCFYNQDWYINEEFSKEKTLEPSWYLIKKKIVEESRGKEPISYMNNKVKDNKLELPSAILVTYCFFANFFHNSGEILWQHDYLWCNDRDINGDQIYVGRYHDINGINKNGFSIHRHLRINNSYGISFQIQ